MIFPLLTLIGGFLLYNNVLPSFFSTPTHTDILPDHPHDESAGSVIDDPFDQQLPR